MENIPDLDQVVVKALEFLKTTSLPQINYEEFKLPLVVGSGNAEVTGRVLFHDRKVIFASESEMEEKLKTFGDIDGVVLVSASDKKHGPVVEEIAKRYGKPLSLITCNSESVVVNKVVFPMMDEPYTYNVSSYLGMILSKTKENPREILEYINQLSLPELGGNKYLIVVPDKFAELRRMFQIKFMELFGRNVAVNVETESFVPHAVMLVPSDEKVIKFGEDIPLPNNASFGAMMAIGYFVIGKIQESLPPYFRENIADYMARLRQEGVLP